LHLAADALADLQRLEPWLAEEVLDELERLVSTPELIGPALPDWGHVHVLTRSQAGRLHVVTLILDRNDARGLLTLLGVQAVVSG
jgi:hypothetical protein